MRSTIFISFCVSALFAQAAAAQTVLPGCYEALMPFDRIAENPGRSLAYMMLRIEAGNGGMLSAAFGVPAAEGQNAKAGMPYNARIDCVAGPEQDFADGQPIWIEKGGLLCSPVNGQGLVQVLSTDSGVVVRNSGFDLANVGSADPVVRLTTYGNVAVSYSLAPAPELCADMEGT